jgi:hypothetical protein
MIWVAVVLPHFKTSCGFRTGMKETTQHPFIMRGGPGRNLNGMSPVCMSYTRTVWKVRGLTLLLRVGTLWRCGDGLFFEVPPLASDALLRTLHPLLENVLQTVDHFEISCLGAPFSWLEKPRNRMGRDLDCMADFLVGFYRSTLSKPNTEFSSNLDPVRFLGFSNHEKGAPRQISRWSTVCSTFSRSQWSVLRSASLGKRGTSKKRPSPHLREVQTPRSNKVSPRTLQTALLLDW